MGRGPVRVRCSIFRCTWLCATPLPAEASPPSFNGGDPRETRVPCGFPSRCYEHVSTCTPAARTEGRNAGMVVFHTPRATHHTSVDADDTESATDHAVADACDAARAIDHADSDADHAARAIDHTNVDADRAARGIDRTARGQRPRGRRCRPHGKGHRPHGQRCPSHGAGHRSHERRCRPRGEGQPSHGRRCQPRGETNRPHGHRCRPLGEGLRPCLHRCRRACRGCPIRWRWTVVSCRTVPPDRPPRAGSIVWSGPPAHGCALGGRWSRGVQKKPSLPAFFSSGIRLRTPNFSKSLSRWLSTVRRWMPNLSAISA